MIRRVFLLMLSSGALLLTLVGTRLEAQSANTVGSAKMLQGDYAVPDAPALKMLEVDESTILRPASVKALTSALSSATGGFSFIPRALGVELSPGLLLNGEHLTITQYRQNPLWYRTRFSIAAKRDSASARSQIALGIRLGLEDQSDLRTNAEFEKAILALTDWKVDSMQLATRKRAAAGVPVNVLNPTKEQQAIIDQAEKDAAAELAQRAKGLRDAVKRARENALWNANVFDLALAVRSSSSDSPGQHARFDGVAEWATKGWALGRTAQLLIGARGAYERDADNLATSDLRGAGDAAVRLYAGSNEYKLLAEAQGTGRSSAVPRWLANIGGELQVADVMWLQASAGWKADGALSKGKYVSSFKFKFNPPGL